MTFLFVFIPALLAIAIGLQDQYARKHLVGSVTLTLTSALIIVRYVILGFLFEQMPNEIPALRLMECIASLYIMPCMYMFLCDQCGTRWSNLESKIMLALPLLTLLGLPALGLEMFSNIPIRNYVICIQCLIIVACMGRLWFRIKEYELKLSPRLIFYYIWMAVLLPFTIYSFITQMEYSESNTEHWIFFVFYTVMIALGFLLIPYSFHVRPIVTQEEEEPVVLDTFVRQNAHLVERLHIVMEEEKFYLKSEIHLEDLARTLNTNRTYVTRLMRQEYGQTFTEYVNTQRIAHSQELLLQSNLNLEEIASRSGFQSSSNYCRTFKRHMGVSPMAWVRQQSGSTATAD